MHEQSKVKQTKHTSNPEQENTSDLVEAQTANDLAAHALLSLGLDMQMRCVELPCPQSA